MAPLSARGHVPPFARMLAAVAGLVAGLLLSGGSSAQVAIPPLGAVPVIDQTGTLDAAQIAALSGKLTALKARKGAEVAVLVVATTQPEEIEEFALRVAETWKPGRAKVWDGAIFVVAKGDRKMRLEVGRGLEGALTDALSKRITADVVRPHFRSGDYAGGLAAGIDAIVKAVDGEELPAPTAPPDWTAHDSGFDWGGLLFGLFGVVFIAGSFFRAMFGRLGGGAVTGAAAGGLAWMMAAPLAVVAFVGLGAFLVTALLSAAGAGRGARRSGNHWGGGWGGGGGGGWGSSGGGGGFSSGGGSFGGGGSSSDW
jgi:uncharacterized protein